MPQREVAVTRPAFCASCTNESDTLKPEVHDGKTVWLCEDCREGDVRLYSFSEPVRYGGQWSAARGGATGVDGGRRHSMGDGNHRVTGGGLSIGARNTGKR